MSGPLVLGLDVSTTAAKAVIVDASGNVLAQGRATFPLENPEPRAWEQDASRWLEATLDSAAAAVALLPASRRGAVAAVAIAHQRETFVLADLSGAALDKAIVWMDGRSTPEVAAAVRELDADRIHRLSGKVPCTTPSLYKIRMQLERLRPDLDRHTLAALDVHAYLVRQLTGELVTSTASADPMGLVAMERGVFSDELCGLARLRPENMPALVAPGTVIAQLLPAVAARIGLPGGVLLAAGAGDGQAAGLGAGVVDEGNAYLNVGTALVAGVPSQTYRTARSYRTLVSCVGDYLLETDLKGGTLTLDWLADRLLGEGPLEGTEARFQRLAALEERAALLPAGAQGLMALPYWAGVMNPHWDDDAGGALIGLRADHGPHHLFRAICEGLAFEQRLAFEGVESDTRAIRNVVVTGGAMQRPFLQRLFASALGRPLARSVVDECTALGAALLAFPAAGLGGIRESAKRIARWHAPELPGADEARYSALFEGAYRNLFAALSEPLRALAVR